MKRVDDFRLCFGRQEYVPIVVGGMGVDISTAELALEAARLGGVGHISDAMVPFVADRRFGFRFTQAKAVGNEQSRGSFDKSNVKFNHEDLYRAQKEYISRTIERKQGSGAIFVNVMEKLTMAEPAATLRTRLVAAMEGGIDGITLAAGLHTGTMRLIEDHARFRDVKIGIIVSSVRALKIFLRSAKRSDRMPDYIVVEGPLAGGHLGFGEDWRDYSLRTIVAEVLAFLSTEGLSIPVIPAGGVFTGTDAVELLETGASAVQVATRFTVTRECGLPKYVKQHYFDASLESVIVTCVSPTGYPLRMLAESPCLHSLVRPACEPFGYILGEGGSCQYLDAYQKATAVPQINGTPACDKICLCYHFSKHNCWTCGHNVYRLKDTTRRLPDGTYQILSAEHVFKDYQFGVEHQIALPAPEDSRAVAAA